ncbi:MAG: MFS transporter [Ilumatobacteraceae bacterium]
MTTGSVWSIRDFRIAWVGGLVNDTGDWLLMVALPVYVYTETRSGSATAVLFVCQLIAGGLLGPYGGSLVDRWNLQRCLVATNLAQAVTILPLLAVTPERIWPAYPVVVAQAVLTQLNNPANVALLPRLVGPDQLTSANAALGASASIARFVGSPLGGILVVWRGLGPVVAIDAVSFLVVAVTIGRLTADTAPIASTDDAVTGVRAGWRAMAEHPPLRTIMAIEGFAQLAQGGFVVLFVVFVVEALGDDGAGVGIIRGTMAIGGLAGAALIGRLAGRIDPTVLFGLDSSAWARCPWCSGTRRGSRPTSGSTSWCSRCRASPARRWASAS